TVVAVSLSFGRNNSVRVRACVNQTRDKAEKKKKKKRAHQYFPNHDMDLSDPPSARKQKQPRHQHDDNCNTQHEYRQRGGPPQAKHNKAENEAPPDTTQQMQGKRSLDRAAAVAATVCSLHPVCSLRTRAPSRETKKNDQRKNANEGPAGCRRNS
ncbi:unnamed protein product, partial [Ectocarpus sp. 8 AP-2014]